MTEPPGTPAPPTRVPMKRVIQAAVSLVIVAGIFVFAIPRVADYSAVWRTLTTLTPLELGSLVAVMLFNLVTYWWQNMAALPGLRFGQAAVVTQTTTSVANTLPGGGAIAVGLTYTILRSWGFAGSDVALYVGTTGVWNVFMKLGLPIVSLGILAITGRLSSALVIAAVVGLLVLCAAVGSFALALWKEHLARRVGEGIGRILTRVRGWLRKPPVVGLGDRAASFRSETIRLVERRWFALTLTTVISHLGLFFVLLLSLRHVGVSSAQVSTPQVLAVFAFGRLISALPITPGGLGVIELGYIGGLVAAGGSHPKVVAAVLVFRALTYGVQIPLGGFTYLVWRARTSWRPIPAPSDVVAPRA